MVLKAWRTGWLSGAEAGHGGEEGGGADDGKDAAERADGDGPGEAPGRDALGELRFDGPDDPSHEEAGLLCCIRWWHFGGAGIHEAGRKRMSEAWRRRGGGRE